MNGSCPPMLGGQPGARPPENARVKKSSALPACPGLVRPSRARRASRAAGFTLIEVLIALIVLVLGVLGAAGMTLASIRDAKQSGLRAQASALAYEVGDLMRANPGQEGVFTGGPGASVSGCWGAGCSPSDMAKNDFYEWTQKLSGPNGLPNGSAVICHDATNLKVMACDNNASAPLVVKLQWDEKNNQSRGALARGATNDDGTSASTAVTTRIMAVVIQPAVGL